MLQKPPDDAGNMDMLRLARNTRQDTADAADDELHLDARTGCFDQLVNDLALGDGVCFDADVAVSSKRNLPVNMLQQHTEMTFGAVQQADLDRMIVSMRQNGLAQNSISSYLRVFRTFLHWCAKEGYTTLDIPNYKQVETVKETYTDEELLRLLKKTTPDCNFCEYRNWVIINLLLNSGCRAATIRSFLVKDVNLNNATITYRHTKNKSIQIVPLCSEMVSVMREYMKVRNGEANDVLFPNESGKAMTEAGLREAVRYYNRSRGVEKTSIHLFRHTFAERYLRNGGNPFNLQKILGHSTLDMTRHYCKIYDADLIKGYDSFSPLATLR